MNSITQNMKFRQSLMKYSQKYGVSQASRKYNKARSYIYFWLNRWDGSIESLAEHSRRPHHHPNEHTADEISMIQRYHHRNPNIELTELWHRLKKNGYTRRVESLYRVMKKLGMLPAKPEKKKRVSKPYERMSHPGERVQIDVKVVPRKCIANPDMKLYQYTAIDEYSRLRFLYGYEEQSTYSSSDFARRAYEWFKRKGIIIKCIQTDNGFEFTNRFSPSKKDKKTMFEKTLISLNINHKLIRPYTPRHNGKVERSHREDHNKFYSCHSFYSCDDLNKQLITRYQRTNNRPMRPLNWLSPIEFFSSHCLI